MFGALERFLEVSLESWKETKTTKTGEMVSLSPEIFVHSYHVHPFFGGKVGKIPLLPTMMVIVPSVKLLTICTIWMVPVADPAIESPVFHGKKHMRNKTWSNL